MVDHWAETVPDALDGERLDRLVAMVTGCSRSAAAAALAAGNVTVEGAVVSRPSTRVAAGQLVRIEGDPHPVEEPLVADPSVPFRVVHEDPDVVVVDKPAGVVVHPGAGHRGSTLVAGLLARYPELATVGQPDRPGIVHRLDKGTSGLMMVARSPLAYRMLVEEMAAHRVTREYDALVIGAFDAPAGTIDAPVGRSRRDPLKMTVTSQGRPARTHYEVTATYREPIVTSRLRCRLETGRTHQIRVHLRSIGRPVVGDDLYGGVRQALPLDRPFLHAARLAFDHPRTGRRMEFTSPLPEELSALLARCR